MATNRKVSSSAIPNSMAKMKSPGSVDIPRYFYFYLTPPELEAMSSWSIFAKILHDTGGNDFAL